MQNETIELGGYGFFSERKILPGVIFQSNYHTLNEILFCYFEVSYQDKSGIFDEYQTIAKFTVKPK